MVSPAGVGGGRRQRSTLYVVCRWVPRLESSCRCVVGLSALKNAVECLRAERYSQDNEGHEAQLIKVGTLVQQV